MATNFPLISKIRKPSPWIIGLVAVGIVGTAAGSYVIWSDRASAPDISELTVPVASEAITVRITASGTVQPIQTVNLSPKTTSLLEELYVEQGDRVEEGELIAQMENAAVAAELAQARAGVAQARARLAEVQAGNRPQEINQAEAQVARAQASVAEAQARVNRAEERVQRNRLLQTEGAISRDELDAVLNEAETARATLEQTRASLRESQENLQLIRSGSRVEEIAVTEAQLAEAIASQQAVEVRYEDTFIRAPFAGIITQKFATEGSFVSPTTSASEASSATSTAVVALATGLEIIAEVPEVDIDRIQPNQRVEIVADAFPEQVFQGRVKLIAPEAIVEQNVTFFQVRIELVTGEEQLRSGMNVDLEFIGDELDNALVVPTVAIVTQDGRTGVLVPDDNNEIQFQPVTLGPAVGDQTQILEGLDSGDRVFIDLPPGEDLNNLTFGRTADEEE